FGDEPDPRREAAHPEEERLGPGAIVGRELLLAALGRKRGPEVPGSLPGRRPRVTVCRAVPVAVPVVARPAGPTPRARPDLRVHAPDGRGDVRIARGELAETDELEEAGIDHLALVERRAAVADVVGDRRVRVTGLREPDEVPRRERPVRRHRPA